MNPEQKWLENLRKAAPVSQRHSRPASDSLLSASVFDSSHDAGDVTVSMTAKLFEDGAADGPDLLGDSIRSRRDAALLKNFVADESWDAPLTKTTAALSLEKSRERFEEVCTALKKVFGESEEYREAIAIAKRALDEERAAIILGRELPRAAGAEDAGPLSKAAIGSEMFSMLTRLRKHCIENETELLEKAAKALDLAAFLEISGKVIERAEGVAA